MIEKQSPNKLKMDTAFLNISTDLSQPIEISGISSDCYKVGENVSQVVNQSKTICLYKTDKFPPSVKLKGCVNGGFLSVSNRDSPPPPKKKTWI